jgi:hypothetical protein
MERLAAITHIANEGDYGKSFAKGQHARNRFLASTFSEV